MPNRMVFTQDMVEIHISLLDIVAFRSTEIS